MPLRDNLNPWLILVWSFPPVVNEAGARGGGGGRSSTWRRAEAVAPLAMHGYSGPGFPRFSKKRYNKGSTHTHIPPTFISSRTPPRVFVLRPTAIFFFAVPRQPPYYLLFFALRSWAPGLPNHSVVLIVAGRARTNITAV